MKILLSNFLFFFLLVTSCKTCPSSPVIKSLVNALAAYGQCDGREEMKTDITDLLTKTGFCKDDFSGQEYLRLAPDGCSAKCIACEAVAKPLTALPQWPAKWQCKKPVISPELVDMICLGL